MHYKLIQRVEMNLLLLNFEKLQIYIYINLHLH